MKIDALDHPKLFDLAARLGCSRPCAIGHLELLWRFTAKHAPRGDVGRYPDGAIARACDWTGDPTVFVSSLLGAGWLDQVEEFRLVVHDWADHVERWVLAKLAKSGQTILAAPYIGAKAGGAVEGSADASAGASPSQAKPSQAKEKDRAVAGPAGDLLGDQASNTSTADCPHDAIVALYHELLPLNPRVRVWTDKRRKALQARWRSDPKHQTLDWWRKFFAWCCESEFLTGRSKPGKDREQPFIADLEWMVTESNFVKILERKYHREAGQ